MAQTKAFGSSFGGLPVIVEANGSLGAVQARGLTAEDSAQLRVGGLGRLIVVVSSTGLQPSFPGNQLSLLGCEGNWGLRAQ